MDDTQNREAFHNFYRFCDLVVRIPDYRSRGLGLNSRRYQIFWEVAGLERGPLSLVNTIKELLVRNSSGSGLEIYKTAVGIRCADNATSSIRKIWN
jgi:hypothetical protein